MITNLTFYDFLNMKDKTKMNGRIFKKANNANDFTPWLY